MYNAQIAEDGVSGSELINTYNALNIPNKQQLYDIYLKHRLQTVRDKYKEGIKNRTKTYR